MTDKQVYDLTKYLFESWERGADYDNYHTDSMCVLEALAQPAQEPFTYYDLVRDAIRPFGCDGDIALYTAPQQRPWVGLTEDDVNNALYKYHGWREFAAELERLLKEKNNG